MTAEAFLDEEQESAESFLDAPEPAPAVSAEEFLDAPERQATPILLDDRFPAAEPTTTPLEPVNLYGANTDQSPAPIDMGAEQANSLARDALADSQARRGIFTPDSPPYRLLGDQYAIDPLRYDDAAAELWKEGLIDSDQYFRMMRDAGDIKAVANARRELELLAGQNPELKSALHGLARGGVQLTAALGVGATTAAALAPTGPGAIGGGIAAGVGSSILAGDMFDTFAEQIAKQDENIASILAARDLFPGYDTAGQLASILIPAPTAVTRLKNATSLIATERGAGEAAKFVARVTGTGAGIGLGTDLAVQGGIAAIDLATDRPISFSPESLGISTALGGLTAGLGVRSANKLYSPDELVGLEQRAIGGTASAQEAADYAVMRQAIQTLRQDDKLLSADAVRRATADFMGTRALDVTEIINPRFQQQALADAGLSPSPAGRPALPYAAENPQAGIPLAGSPATYTGQTFIDRGGPAPAFQGGTTALPGPAGVQPLPAPAAKPQAPPPPPPATPTEPSPKLRQAAATPEPVRQSQPVDPSVMREQKKFLVSEIDRLLAEAPDITPQIAGQQARPDLLTEYKSIEDKLAKLPTFSGDRFALQDRLKAIDDELLAAAPKVTIEVPGDGVFTIHNTKQTLTAFASKAKKFPTTVARPDVPAKPASSPSQVPAVASKSQDWVKASGAFTSNLSDRENINYIWQNSEVTVATDGRMLLLTRFGGKQPAKAQSVPLGSSADTGWILSPKTFKPVSKESIVNYPDWRQVMPAQDSYIPLAEVDAGQLLVPVNQARAFLSSVKSEDSKIIQLSVNPDFTIGVSADGDSAGDEFIHNVQPGAKLLGRYQADRLRTVLGSMRSTGQSIFRIHGTSAQSEIEPLAFENGNAFALLMPMRSEGPAGPIATDTTNKHLPVSIRDKSKIFWPSITPAATPKKSKSSGSKSKADSGPPGAAAPPPPKPAAPPPQETWTDAQVYADYPEAVGVQRAANGAWTMPVILGATDKVPVIEMPELVEIFRSLSGNTPRLKALRKSLGLFHPEGTGEITLHPKLFVDEKSAMMTLAHEIGHFIDFMDDRSMTKGNVLGIVAGLSNYLKHHIPLDPNAQMSEGWAFSGQPITKSERAEIRARAEEDLIKSLEGELRRVIVEEPVFAQVGVTPDTVRELFGLDAREKWPEMYDWFARQSAEVKKEIVKKAMKGLVDERMAKFAIQGEQIGTTTREEVQNIGGRAPTPQEFRAAIDNAMRAEMQARNVADLKYVRDELIALSSWWKPFDLARSKDSYVRYRLSAAELYADALSVLFNSPADLEKRAPVFWTVFWNYMDARPQVKAKLMEVQERILKGKDAVLDKRLQQDLEAYKAGAETFIRKHDAAVYRRTHLTGWWDDLKDQYWNRYQPIIEAAAKARAAGKITRAEEDAYRWLTEQHPLADSKLQVKLADIGRIYQDLDAAGIPRYYFGQYLEVKRVLADRAQMANPGGKTPRTAQEMLDYLTGQLGPEKTAALEASVSKFRDVVFDILTDANDSGLFSPDLWQTMLANRDSYATFTPVEYVEEYLPAPIRKQVGTFASIADPAQQTILKVIALHRAAQNNRFKSAAVQAIREVAPEVVKTAPVKFNGKAMVPQPPRDTNFRLVQWKRQGQLVGVHLPIRYARMWDDKSPAERDAILRLIQTGFSRFVYSAIIRYNPAFQLFMSPARDLQRSLTNMPGGTKGRALFLANLLNPETWGASLDWAQGDVGKSALMREMIENMAVGGPHTAFGGRNQSDDDAISTILQKFHLMGKAPRNAWIRALVAPLKGIEFAGQILQLLPKAAAYRAMVKNMGVPAPQAANTIRNHIGIPNYYKRGRNVQTAGSVIPFLNIFLRSYESLWRNMSGKERNMGGKEWWLAWLLTGGGLYAILQTLAKEGVFGEDLRRLYSRVPDYDMTNYAVLPLGEVPTGELGGKTVYARLPQDEGLRVINGVVQKLVSSAIRSAKGDPTAPQMGEVLAGVTATVPGVNPVVSTADAWVDYMRGLNPRDTFRNRSILTDDEYLAGGWASTRTMLGWTLGETGVTNFFNYDSQADTLTETTISATPVLNRFIKITDRGLAQGEAKDRRLEERDMARFRVGLPDFIKGLRTEYYYLQRLGADRTDAQELRYNELKFWRRGYQQSMDQIETAMEMDNRSEVQMIRNFLIQDSQYYRTRY